MHVKPRSVARRSSRGLGSAWYVYTCSRAEPRTGGNASCTRSQVNPMKRRPPPPKRRRLCRVERAVHAFFAAPGTSMQGLGLVLMRLRVGFDGDSSAPTGATTLNEAPGSAGTSRPSGAVLLRSAPPLRCRRPRRRRRQTSSPPIWCVRMRASSTAPRWQAPGGRGAVGIVRQVPTCRELP